MKKVTNHPVTLSLHNVSPLSFPCWEHYKGRGVAVVLPSSLQSNQLPLFLPPAYLASLLQNKLLWLHFELVWASVAQPSKHYKC